MKVYKNGICREIDQKREQEFREKGYVIEGKETTDIVEVLKQENEALKQENEVLKMKNEALVKENENLCTKSKEYLEEIEVLRQENEALKAHTGGEENAGIRTGNEVKEITARGEGSATSEQTTTTGQIKATTRGRK